MATSRLPPATLTLKQFMRRQQVLLLYRRILQAIRQVPNDSDRKYLKDWAREEFKRNKSATEEDTIRMMITQGNMQLKETDLTSYRESEQHLEDVEKILHHDKWYVVLGCVPEEGHKLMVAYVNDLHCQGPAPPPTASEPTKTE